MIENRLVGIKSREVYEVAGSLALIKAHQAIEDLVLTRDLLHFKKTIESKLADMIYEGQWFDPLTEACKAFLMQSQERVTGDVRLKFYKGNCVVEGRKSDLLCTATSSPPTPTRTSSRTRPPRASSSCGACPSRCGPRWARRTT